MMPLNEDDEDYYRSGMRGTPTTVSATSRSGVPTTPRGSLKSNAERRPSITSTRDTVDTVTKQLRHVQFSDMNGLELEATPRTTMTHHNNTASLRRLAIDEVELCYSEETKFPAALDDYVVRKFVTRDDVIIGGTLDLKEESLIKSRWVTHWAELYNGVLILYKYKDTIDRTKLVVVPIGGCTLNIIDVRQFVMEIQYKYQGRDQVSTIRGDSILNLFLWWWAFQLASVDRDERLLYSVIQRQGPSTLWKLMDSAIRVENVLFPRVGRAPTRRLDRPMVTHLILVRHGETENMHFRVPDREKGLTKRGQQQAEMVAATIAKELAEADADVDNVQLLFGGLQRTFDTAKEFEKAMPWIQYKNECCLLEEGAPKRIEKSDRVDFRAAMHHMASEYIVRFDPDDPRKLTANNTYVNYKILVGHSSFIQHCIAQAYGISKEVVKIGAAIGHCSITQIDITKDGDAAEHYEVAFTNRVKHLPLTHRSSE